MSDELLKLATEVRNATAEYQARAILNTPTEPAEQVAADLAYRSALRRMLSAEDAYKAALDAELDKDATP